VEAFTNPDVGFDESETKEEEVPEISESESSEE
jgi:hypothetical protein